MPASCIELGGPQRLSTAHYMGLAGQCQEETRDERRG